MRRENQDFRLNAQKHIVALASAYSAARFQARSRALRALELELLLRSSSSDGRPRALRALGRPSLLRALASALITVLRVRLITY